MSKVKTKSIRATSRCAMKIKDNFFTVEYSEERIVEDDITEEELIEERKKLWQDVNAEVDNQLDEIEQYFS